MASLREHAEELLRLLDGDQVISSDTWFGLRAALGRLTWVVGSMTHCIHEWREPEDTQADSDEFTSPGDELLTEHERMAVRTRRHGRRNPYLWRER